MPRLAMDYSKCVIYKIVCLDPEIENCYVGHTTNFKSRKSAHKQNCNVKEKRDYGSYVYNFIRENGGWDNWNMVIIEDFDCENYLQARQREQYWITELKASLNKIDSFTTTEEQKQKTLDRANKWAEQNKERVKENKKRWAEQNKDKISKKARLKYQEKLVQTENKNI
jgi:hypothetical protein